MPLLFANDLDFNGHKGINLAAPTPATNDAARIVDVETASTADRARANHTGSQLASTISNFTAAVQAIQWASMAVPTGAVNMNSQLVQNVATAISGTDAVNLNQLNAAISGAVGGLNNKGVVDVVHIANVNIANPGTATFDGLTVATGQVVLLDGQTTGAEDGPWTFNGSGVAMTRPTNWDTIGEAMVGSYWVVKRGTQADKIALMTNDTFTLGTDEADFGFFSFGVSGALTGYAQNVGTGSPGPYAIAHGLGATAVQVQVRELSGGYFTLLAWKPTDNNTVSLEPDETWASNSHQVAVVKVA
jgi:hypothetical protein